MRPIFIKNLLNTYEVGFSSFRSVNGSKSAASTSLDMLNLSQKYPTLNI